MLEGVALGVLLSFAAAFTINVAAFGAALKQLRRRGWRDRRHRRPWIRRMTHSPASLIVYGQSTEQAAERLVAGIEAPPTERGRW